MSQNGKRKASSEDAQESSSKRQRLGELEYAGARTNTTVPANVTGQPTTTIYGTIADQAGTRGQGLITQTQYGLTASNAAGVGAAVDSNNDAQAVDPANSTGAKRKRSASSSPSEQPNLKQSARGQKRAGLHEAGLNDKERGIVQQRDDQLYCKHPVDKKWLPAVFHSAIRAELIAAASARGSYSVERARGALENDVTSYLESQSNWSGERQHWPRIRHNVLNRHERNGWRDDYYRQRAQVWIHTDGRMVIDHDRNPMYRHPDLPDTLSSAVEGWYLEAVMRLDSRILRETIRARLPDVRRPPKSRKSESEGMYALTAISNKRLRFRQDEGLVAWDSRAVSGEMNDYFRSFIPQASLDRNSNEGGRTLSKAEREHGKNLGKGKSDQKRDTLSSSTTRTPDQRTTASPFPGSQDPAQHQKKHSAYGGSMLPRAENHTSPSPLTHANGQRPTQDHQAGQALDRDSFPFLPDEGFNSYQTHHFEPIPSAFNQGNAAPHTSPMGPPLPAYFDGTSLAGFSSSAPYYNLQHQLVGQPQRIGEPQNPEQPRNRIDTSGPNSTPGQTNGRTAKPRGSRRGRARWRNNDPPIHEAAALRSSGGVSAGNCSNATEHSSGPSGSHGYIGILPAPANMSHAGLVAHNVGTAVWNDSTSVAGVVPPFSNSNGNGRAGGSVQQPTSPPQETPLEGTSHLTLENGQQSNLDDNPFGLDDAWPTALDLELLGFIQTANATVDPNTSGNGVENAPQGTAGQGSGPQVYYDDSAPLQDGQQNSVWRLDDNGNWVLDQEHEQRVRNQPVIASNNTANRQPPADTNGKSLASTRASPQIDQTTETPISIGNTPVPTASIALCPTQPTPSSGALDQPSMTENNTLQEAASSDNASSYSPNVPPTTRTEDSRPAEEIDPHQAIPTNNFQYATIQTLLAPTRRDFISAFQDESWRSYVPRDFVPPTDRSLSLLGAFEQLSVDFWEIWTSRFGDDVEVPPLALPSDIDEFSAAVLLGLPYP